MPNSSIELQFGREIIIYGGKWNIQQLSDLLVELNIQVVIAKRVSMICLKRGRSLSEGHWLGPEKLYFMYFAVLDQMDPPSWRRSQNGARASAGGG